MITHKIENFVGIAVVAALIAFAGLFASATTHAQTVCTIPADYIRLSNGIYYNSKVGLYLNPTNCTFSVKDPTVTTTVVTDTTTSTFPTGFQGYGGLPGIYYNSATGQYYNNATGQYSTIAPLGGASMNANGTLMIPQGYTASLFGTYYNSATGLYYDPSTGFYSSTAPTGQVSSTPTPITVVVTPTPTTPTTVTPGVPNTGAGGDAAKTFAILIMSVLVGATGVVLMKREKLV